MIKSWGTLEYPRNSDNCLHDVDPILRCATNVSEEPATSIFRIEEQTIVEIVL